MPLAIPALAGLLRHWPPSCCWWPRAPERRWEWVARCASPWPCAPWCCLLAERIQRLVGERVVMAFERLMGLILVAISVEMLIRGIKQLAHQL